VSDRRIKETIPKLRRTSIAAALATLPDAELTAPLALWAQAPFFSASEEAWAQAPFFNASEEARVTLSDIAQTFKLSTFATSFPRFPPKKRTEK
jgi:hypothetical protein